MRIYFLPKQSDKRVMHIAASRSLVDPAPARVAMPGGTHRLDDPAALTLLSRIRARSVSTQLTGRIEPFRYCALIEAMPDRETDVYLDAVLKVLPQALDRPLLIRRPSADSASFDEAWLVGLIMAHGRGDGASFAFGIAARVGRPLRRMVGFLVAGLAARIAAERT